MHWNKVSEVGFPKLPDGIDSMLCICAFKRLAGKPKSYICKYEKTYAGGKTTERWKDYYGDYYIKNTDNIIAWMPVPQYVND